jgi:hypothetical protein|tara:strand:- start:286 stop:525 length:240 start_codon:yes stop_codon:yes gene_type:complete
MEGIIRKIIIGRDPKDAMAYYIGMKAGGNIVSTIVLDEKHLHVHGKSRYLIYVEDEDKIQTLWKAIVDIPCMLEFDLNF